MNDEDTQTLDRDGVTIAWQAHGSGPVILLSHGFSATSAMWKSQVHDLASDHTVVTWDMRGHGRSDYPDDPDAYSEAATLDDIDALLDAVGAERAVIAGLSLGGYMSLAYHARRPQRVAGLMLFSTGPGYRNDGARDGWNRNALRTAARFDERGLEALDGRSREMRARGHRDATGLAHAARGMLTQRDSTVMDSLADIAVPTLIVVGDGDLPFLQAGEYMARKIPAAEHVLIEDAGHAVNLDQPKVFNDAVRGFLERHSL